MCVTHLFRKVNGRMIAKTQLQFSSNGIAESQATSPLRQVLVTQLTILRELGLKPGALRENVVADVDQLHEYPSGTVIHIGEARIRLTFHCEPCRVVGSGALLKALHHRRGVLGLFLNQGVMRVGDSVAFEAAVFEEIPYDAAKRVDWYLSKREAPIHARQLLYEVGLDYSYARALPSYLRRSAPDAARKVRFRGTNLLPRQ
jgi:MOSC domain-containing protein YiiM